MNVSGVTMQHQTANQYLHEEVKKRKKLPTVNASFKSCLEREIVFLKGGGDVESKKKQHANFGE